MSDDSTETQQDFTATSLASAAGVTFGYICQLCRAGKIPARKFGNVWLIRHNDGVAWLAQRPTKQETLSSDEN